MIKITFIFLLFLIPLSTFCQEWQYSTVINGTDIEPKYGTTDQLGNIYILSQFSGSITNPALTSYGATDLFLCKLSPEGTLLWYEQIGNTAGDLPGGITINDGFVYVSGAYNSLCNFNSGAFQLDNTGNTDIFLAKYSLNGIFQYAKRVGSYPSAQASMHIKADNNNHIIMTGYMKDSVLIGLNSSDQVKIKGTPGIISNFIASFDLDGNCVWANPYLGSNTLSRFMRIGISENGYYFGGFFQGNLQFDVGTISSLAPTTYDAFIYKTDFNGTGQWVRRIRGTGTENFKTLTTDEFDNVYVLGNYNSPAIYVDSTESQIKTHTGNIGGYDTYMAKYNRSGILQWFLIKGSSARDIYNDLVMRNNIIYATGYFANQIIFNNDTLRTDNALNEDAFLAAFNQTGDPISGISIKGTGNYRDAGTIVRMDANSRAYVAGYFKSQQIQIGSQIYTSADVNASDLFYAIYRQPFKAVITDQKMISCNGVNDGMLTVTPYFGRPPYSYSWSHNAALNNPVADNLAPGDYTVTVTDAASNVTNISGTISEPGQIQITGMIDSVSCYSGNDGEIDINITGGSGSYQYYWTTLDGSGIIPVSQNQTGLSAGTYTVIVKDLNNCSDTTSFIVTSAPAINFDGTITTPILIPPGFNGGVSLAANGGSTPYSFAWTGPGGFSAITRDLTGLNNAGVYNLTLTDRKGCTKDTSIAVVDNFTFVAQIIAKTDVKCFGVNDGTATVRVTNGTPPYSYQWLDGLLLNDSIRTGMAPGLYVVTVTDNASNTSQARVRITGPSTALSLISSIQDLTCNGNSSGIVNLTVSGGTLPYSYSWNSGYYTGEDLVNVPANTYSVLVTDANGCTAQTTQVVDEPEQIGLYITATDILCHGQTTAIATAHATGGTPPGSFSYLWDDQGSQITPSAYDLGEGTYHCTVTDSNNCQKTASIIIIEPDTLEVSMISVNPTCPGLEDGSLVAQVSGGTGPGYEYVWSNNVFNTRFNTDIPAGIYALTVTDENNCAITDTFSLTDPDSIRFISVGSTDVSCPGKTDGTITIQATGGTGNYEYSTDNGLSYVNTSLITSMPADIHEVVVRDENDCLSDTYPVTISIADTVRIENVTVTDALCVNLNNGSVLLEVSGGSSVYTYSTDGGSNFDYSESTISWLPPGDYNLVARDENDCVSESYPVSVSIDDTVEIDTIVVTNAVCYGIDNGSLLITASGGSPEYEFSIDGGGNFDYSVNNITNLPALNFLVVARDINNCWSDPKPVSIEYADTLRILSVDAVDLSCSGQPDGSITIHAEGGSGIYTYSINGVDFVTNSVFENLTAGNYTISAMDDNQCSSEETDITLEASDVCDLIIFDAFSPNGDEKNPVWNIINAGPEINVKIFNIWGKLIFQSTGYADPWDGTYEGKELPAGTYYYIIDPGDGTDIRTGAVSIVK